ncbi:response regulator transcription factor [Pseudalkalibacillus caeni]|uniref:Response regulator transcription factor n=1 Tax=Exobacillus caeni TaxID=2574798 RepID=A0A5R9F3M5_9BACL|nr:response regulator transcription factor [Pseudalkalibacillus caeni]TLS37099.1 response regulator transcription factor [Pseudalkalibacillus caeni]
MINVEKLEDKKILLVDDEEAILDLLEAVLLREGFKKIIKTATGLDGVEKCKQAKPDMIVLDIMLPDIDGYEVCRRIREITYAPILFLSAKSDDVDKLLGLGIGGDDYVVKPFSPKEVVFRIKAQLRRSQYPGHNDPADTNEQQYSFGNILIDAKSSEVLKEGQPVILTAKEYKLLLCLAENANHILSKKRLCEKVWGYDYMGDDNTIMVHIRHLREKLEDDPGNPVFIQTVKGLGYRLVHRGK